MITLNGNVPSAVLLHEMRRRLRCYDGVDASVEGIRGRVRIPELLLGRAARLEFDPGVCDIILEGAHTIDQRLRERDRVVQSRSVDPGKSPILKPTGIHDGFGIRW